MIDIHSHLLPGIDDGPRTWEESVLLCRAVAAEGVRRSVATPHLIDGVYNNTRRRVESLVRELNQRLQDAGVALDVSLGAAGTLVPRLDWSYEDEKRGLAGTSSLAIERYDVLDARLAWIPPSRPWELALAVTNLTDELYFYNVFDLRNIGAWAAAQPAPPRRFVLTVRRTLGRH